MNPAEPASPEHEPQQDISAMMNWALGADDPTEVISADTTKSTARPAADNAGMVIGHFTLVRQLGHGGFGEVWEAEQHKPIRRTVALKLIKPGMASADVLQRFDAERQALAMMDHPNIARVFDAGATPDGRPWFAMELVDGSALTTYCDRKRLTIRQRLDLFIKVCAAVQHAHQKAVLHRDLKPSNILVSEVDGQPAPKVIDFGIAKALEQPLTGGAVMTLQGQLIGTPQYMSPEQVGMTGDVDTRSDVYSLGVILYELLTGHPPLDPIRLRKAALDEICRIIREEEPPKPSTHIAQMEARMAHAAADQHGTDTRRWTRELSGELDWIIMRALEKERERRYASAQDLAEDIERHLRNEPVEAGPPSTGYRLRKFVRRNRFAVGSAAAMLVLLAAGVGGVLWQAFRASRAESLALTRLEQVTREKQRGDDEAAIAKAVNDFLQNDLLRQASSVAQADARFDADPNLTVRQALDRAAERIGARFKNQPLVEAAIRLAVGDAYDGIGEAANAVEHLERSMALRKTGLGLTHPDTLWVMNNLAAAYKNSGRLGQALSLYQETLELKKRTLGAGHQSTLITMIGFADTLESTGKLQQALHLLEETLKQCKLTLGLEHPTTLAAMNGLATTYQSSGKLQQALQLHEEALKQYRSTLGPEHPRTLISMGNLAKAHQKAGQLDQALPLHEAVFEICKKKLGPTHGVAYWRAKKLDFSVPLFEELVQLQASRLGPDHADTLRSKANLAVNYRDSGRTAEARQLLDEVLGKMDSLTGEAASKLQWVRQARQSLDGTK